MKGVGFEKSPKNIFLIKRGGGCLFERFENNLKNTKKILDKGRGFQKTRIFCDIIYGQPQFEWNL